MDRLTNALITAAALAGRYRAEARDNPGARPGWQRMADRWSAVVAQLAGDLVEAAGCQTQGVQPPPIPGHNARHGRS